MKVQPLDVFNFSPSRTENDKDWVYKDISDDIQLFFEISVTSTNVQLQNISVRLANKETGETCSTINLAEKNIIKLIESKHQVRKYQNLNEKFFLFWQIKDLKRNGLINFDYPINLVDDFEINISLPSRITTEDVFSIVLEGRHAQPVEGQSKFELFVENRESSNQYLIDGDTKFFFDLKFRKIFIMKFYEQDEYPIYIIVRVPKLKKAYLYRKNIIVT